jgi:hypothetical protein
MMSQSRTEGRQPLLQDVRGFSVQIRHIETEEPIGTGIVISHDGKIVTCAHVVRDALGIEAHEALLRDAEVGVYFPMNSRLGRAAQSCRAKVVAYFPDYNDDVALLQVQGALPLTEQFAILAEANGSSGHEFKSFGYRRLKNYIGLPARGQIIDFADQPQDRKLQSEPLVLQTEHVDGGMSGAAVLDVE